MDEDEISGNGLNPCPSCTIRCSITSDCNARGRSVKVAQSMSANGRLVPACSRSPGSHWRMDACPLDQSSTPTQARFILPTTARSVALSVHRKYRNPNVPLVQHHSLS
ncbi:uncharacterized protein LAESUDRAFT_730536 [Laetiporus sulphureus 93-53]|uniref:Uncharacterized protein n=1 Tax=Laetiporus sulphureus 93-53 TaxID=1314785 RepID=A0A165C1I1_9APHY|nr:uncharacterized protein LAESUDRAFT_730536 [Laetiporus sulphureus 93-53]KZT02032.1 hypothetical protein LAESUDRAFT_730536 [Laetiporus sulphureus 93-53]